MQAVRESGAKHKRISKIKKKFLTNRTGCVKLKKLRDEKRIAWSAANSTKEFKKLCKKCLTNLRGCDRITELPRERVTRTVPCKLNNVKTN